MITKEILSFSQQKAYKVFGMVKEQFRYFPQIEHFILVCGGRHCSGNNSFQLIDAFNNELSAQGLKDKAIAVKSPCLGLCEQTPNIYVYPNGMLYSNIQLSDIKSIVKEHIKEGRVVTNKLTVIDA